MKIRTIIVEDERLARKEMQSLLNAFPQIEIIDEATNVSEGITKIEEHKPDLIFLDINMPANKTGFDLLEVLDHTPKVIFTTAHDEYAIKAFEVNALDYLLKPIEEDRLKEAIEKLETVLQAERGAAANEGEKKLKANDKVFVKDGERCWFVRIGDVRFFETAGNYSKVIFDKNRPLILKSLNALEERLDEGQFFRANRKQIINLEFIDKIHPHFNGGLKVILSCGEDIEISRRQASKFKEKMAL
jgi:two-component system, LytTR family, response regulator